MLNINRILDLPRLLPGISKKDPSGMKSPRRKLQPQAREQKAETSNETNKVGKSNIDKHTPSIHEQKAKELKRTGYFNRDPSKHVDYVLVSTYKVCNDPESNTKIREFLNALIEFGVDFEIDFGQEFDEYLFIKINVSDIGVAHLANLYRTPLSCDNVHYVREWDPTLDCMKTELNKFEKSKLMPRAPVSIAGERPRAPTNAERAMLLDRLMNETYYGTEPNEFGLSGMLKKKLFVDGYTLHEGTVSWTKHEALSDRQLLARFWANFRRLFKSQPLNLIENYFGTEVGMYFAWLEYYIKFLIPASIVGILSSIIGTFNTYFTDKKHVTDEVCNSNLTMCPYCEHYSLCPYSPLRNECDFTRLAVLLDNPMTVFFSMFMSVWATVFMVMWQRRLSCLKLRWNVRDIHVEETVRQEFVIKATAVRVSKVTGEVEPYIPNYRHCTQFTLTNATVLFCALIVFSVALSVIMYQYKLRYIANTSREYEKSRNASWMATITGSLFIGLSIVVFTVVYEKVAFWLTVRECPRTQETFDKAFIVKNCLLNFSNCYAAVTYLAFFKGKFFTYPGDSNRWNIMGGILTDQCGPGGCLLDVGVQLGIVMIAPSFCSSMAQIIIPYVKLKIRHFSRIYYRKDIPQWELDFYLESTDKYYMFNEYRDLLIQYGYITCFVCALPLAPLLALIRNVFEIRIDARKFLRYQKRHIARKVDGLGAYNNILTWITYISVFTNACVIAFSSNFIPRTIYRARFQNGLVGYVNSTLSVFNTADYETSKFNATTNMSTCYYHGMRHPPDHPQKYQLRNDYYHLLVGQLTFVLVFEHVIMLVKLLLVSIVREIPRYVREKLRMQDSQVRISRKKSLNDAFRSRNSTMFSKPVIIPMTPNKSNA